MELEKHKKSIERLKKTLMRLGIACLALTFVFQALLVIVMLMVFTSLEHNLTLF